MKYLRYFFIKCQCEAQESHHQLCIRKQKIKIKKFIRWSTTITAWGFIYVQVLYMQISYDVSLILNKIFSVISNIVKLPYIIPKGNFKQTTFPVYIRRCKVFFWRIDKVFGINFENKRRTGSTSSILKPKSNKYKIRGCRDFVDFG